MLDKCVSGGYTFHHSGNGYTVFKSEKDRKMKNSYSNASYFYFYYYFTYNR